MKISDSYSHNCLSCFEKKIEFAKNQYTVHFVVLCIVSSIFLNYLKKILLEFKNYQKDETHLKISYDYDDPSILLIKTHTHSHIRVQPILSWFHSKSKI